MIRIFPRVTKCRFYKYGPSANIETVDALCLLPLNIINEKIYIFLWFWFLILAALTGIVLMFRLVIIACPPVRVYLLNMRFRLSQLDHLHMIVRRTSIGDWFLGDHNLFNFILYAIFVCIFCLQTKHIQVILKWFLQVILYPTVYMLGQNIDSVVFQEVIQDLASKSDSQPKERQSLMTWNTLLYI